MRAASGLLAACLALLVSSAAPARAGGLNFMWNDCPADGGVALMTSSCTSDAGTAVASYSLTDPQTQFVGIEAVIDGQAGGGSTPPDWWQFFNPGSCRQTALTAVFTFPLQAQVSCVDPWSGQALGGIAAFQTATTSPPNPNVYYQLRVKLAAAVRLPIALEADREFLSFLLVISSAGTSSCDGCALPATLVLQSIKSAQQDGTNELISSPTYNNCVSWQQERSTYCYVPTVPRSWGQVKGLYR